MISSVETSTDYIKADIPIRLESLNKKVHWAEAARQTKAQKTSVRMIMQSALKNIDPPCQVTLIRVAPRTFDEDNLIGSFKAIRDEIADMLIPGLAPGRADSCPDIKWIYKQQKAVKEYSVVIEVRQKKSATEKTAALFADDESTN